MIKFLSLDILGVSHRNPWKNQNAVYRLQISALDPEMFKFEKWVKYANEMTDDVIHSTQYYHKYTNRAQFKKGKRSGLRSRKCVALRGTFYEIVAYC